MRNFYQAFIFLSLLIVLGVLTKLLTGSYFPAASIENVWLYSGIFMVLFSTFFIEPYYTAPKNVQTNSIALLLVLLSIKDSLKANSDINIYWWIITSYLFIMLLSSTVASGLKTENKSDKYILNIVSEYLKIFAEYFGKAKILYSSIFLVFILFYYSVQKVEVLFLLIFWWLIISLNPSKLASHFGNSNKVKNDSIGKIFSVQSQKIFLVRLFSGKLNAINKFDVVEFIYSMSDRKYLLKCVVFGTYYLNEEKWIKVLHLSSTKTDDTHKQNDVVYKSLNQDDELERILKRFIGRVIENSDIGKIIFEFSSKNLLIEEGDLVEIDINGKSIFYQIVNGITDKEILDAKNESGYIRGEAVQLGIWNKDRCCFEKYGWVPNINSILLKANTSYDNKELSKNEFLLGVIPKTNLPAIFNVDDAVSHHTAVLGVTGAGKSFITREIIKKLVESKKVICVDFTAEYAKVLESLKPDKFIKDYAGLSKISDEIQSEEINSKNKYGDAKIQHINNLKVLKKKVCDALDAHIKEFIESGNYLSLFELPDLSNSTFILEFTQMFLDSIFKFAKTNEGQSICIVIEEAHTVVPETTSLGDLGDYGSNKAIVNKIGQIALQGRKYGVGFFIIAQRTANVSKTVLTQCNSVICFQAFDNTSYDFLGNYLGKEFIKVLPNLKLYHAIAVGKAFKSNVPMIVDLTRT